MVEAFDLSPYFGLTTMSTSDNPTGRTDFTNHFLIAMPQVDDTIFNRALVYVCDYSERGALGLVVNHPTDLSYKSLFERIDVDLEREALRERYVYFGGPIQAERGFVLHEPTSETYLSSMLVPGGLAMTTSKDVLESLAHGTGPDKFLLTLGHAGWNAGQLEEEIANHQWLAVPAQSDIIFDVKPEARFKAALALLGISADTLSIEAGHG